MKAIDKDQCPNCWGYQVYDKDKPEQVLCECK